MMSRMGQGYLSGAADDVLTKLSDLRSKYGSGIVSGGNEMTDIMSSLVAPFFKDNTWQFCTVNQWLNGVPSEDDLGWRGKYFSEMPTLEETCGDHSFFNQYDAAFSDLKDAGCPQDAIDWLRAKGQASFDIKKKGAKAEQEGSQNVQRGVEAAKKSLDPFSPSSPFFWIGLALIGAFAYRTFKR